MSSTRFALRLAALAALICSMLGVIGTQSPANATAPCDRPAGKIQLMGNYVQPYGGGYAKSSCAGVDFPTRQASNRITISGMVKDTATDGYTAVVIARFRVGGVWGTWRVVGADGSESWRSWSYSVTTSARVDAVQENACRLDGAANWSACRTYSNGVDEPLEMSGF